VEDRRPAEPTDAQQIEASLTDPSAFTVLFERHAGPVYRYIVTRVGPRDAEDLVGDTFATAFGARSGYDLRRPDARPWLFGIATNLARHYWRAEARRLARDTASTSGVDVHRDHSDEAVARAYFESQSEPIAKALGQLDDSYIDVLLLVAGSGFSYEEVSVALDIPVGTVRSRLSRARSHLRELLGDAGQYLDDATPVGHTTITSEGWP
jgi:RNA polymerase sigma-70 factor (ECF subfamily)